MLVTVQLYQAPLGILPQQIIVAYIVGFWKSLHLPCLVEKMHEEAYVAMGGSLSVVVN